VNRRLPFSRDSEAGKLPRQQEQEILAAASKVFRSAFPNSERAGCPPPITLLSVVRKRCEAGESERILEHMTCCSACFGEYEALLRKERVSRNLQLLTLCAVLVITIGTAIWFNIFRSAPAVRPPEPLVVQKAPPPTPGRFPQPRVDRPLPRFNDRAVGPSRGGVRSAGAWPFRPQ